jgi:hypothetical protein
MSSRYYYSIFIRLITLAQLIGNLSFSVFVRFNIDVNLALIWLEKGSCELLRSYKPMYDPDFLPYPI